MPDGVRRAVLDGVGGFDESFFLYEEDVDLCLRVRRAGWRVAYTPAAEVVHHLGRSMEQAAARARLEYHRSHLRFYNKHNPLSDRLVLRAWMAGRAKPRAFCASHPRARAVPKPKLVGGASGRMTGPRSGIDARRALHWVLAAALLLMLSVNLPGHLSYDSVAQLHEARFHDQPGETERQTEKELAAGKFAFAQRSGRAAEKILECQDRAAADENDRQVCAHEFTETSFLKTEVTQ